MNSTYRIIDANFNRAAEGLRTIEDYIRFDVEDLSLLTRLKHLRHDLTAAIDLLDRQSLLENRDTRGDEGTDLTTATELNRNGLKRSLPQRPIERNKPCAALRNLASLFLLTSHSRSKQSAIKLTIFSHR